MSDGTGISWADATWNPITGCMVLSPGCVPCYAMKLAGGRLQHHPSRAGLTRQSSAGPVWNGKVRFNEQWLDQPLRWRRHRYVFVVAHGDLFYSGVPRSWQDRVLNVVCQATHHTMLILTKRPYRAWDVLRDIAPMPHVWVGASIEDQKRADERRAPMRMLAEAGWKTWVSYEPALGPVDWTGWEFLHWGVSGGQTSFDGAARPSHPDWHREFRDFCATFEISFHFKQWGDWAPFAAGLGSKFFAKDTTETRWLSHSGSSYTLDEAERLPVNVNTVLTARVGKKIAGALLDGVEHRAMPPLTGAEA